jgi:hypothetical protein
MNISSLFKEGIKLSIILLTFNLLSCQKEIIENREYPRVDISDEVIQSENGIIFKGEIISGGNSPLIEKGFVWGTNYFPDLNSSRIFVDPPGQTGNYEANAKVDFVKDQIYKVRAFARTKDYLVYSKVMEFKCQYSTPAPEISNFTPKQGQAGDILKITGKNFSFLPTAITVTFDSMAELISCSDTAIFVKVPGKSTNDKVSIKLIVSGKFCQSSEQFQYIVP